MPYLCNRGPKKSETRLANHKATFRQIFGDTGPSTFSINIYFKNIFYKKIPRVFQNRGGGTGRRKILFCFPQCVLMWSSLSPPDLYVSMYSVHCGENSRIFRDAADQTLAVN